MLKRMVSFFLAVGLVCLSAMTCFASDAFNAGNTALEVKFKEFLFTTNDYDPAQVRVEYEVNGDIEKANIRDRKTGALLETMEVIPKEESAVGPYTFTRSKSYGKTTLTMYVNVELYSQGSFRQINSIQGSYLGITTSITDTSIEGANVNVWSEGNVFPTAKLFYAYNATLVASVGLENQVQVSADLIAAGFQLSSSTGNTFYYRRAANSNGTISLYGAK